MCKDHKHELTEIEFLQQYDDSMFQHPSIAADMAIFTIENECNDNYRKLPNKKLKLLMICRGEHPFKGQWALAGGFARPNETIEETAKRELMEETGLSNVYMEQLHNFSEVNRDPRTWVVSNAYIALVDSTGASLRAGYDAADTAWFDVTFKLVSEEKKYNEEGYTKIENYLLELINGEIVLSSEIECKKEVIEYSCCVTYKILKNKNIAFDHSKIIAFAVNYLRSQLETSPMAFNLMPKQFTLTQLQQVYEIILDKELLKANFRRKIADKVLETDEFTKNGGHRPSRLYKRNWEAFL